MTTPNLANVVSYYSFTKNLRLSTTEQISIFNTSSNLIRLNSVIAINNSTTTWGSVNLPFLDFVSNTKSNIALTTLSPLSGAVVILDKNLNVTLRENDILYAISNLNNSIDLIINYDSFSEARNFLLQYFLVAGGAAGGFGGGGGGGGGGILVNQNVLAAPGFYTITVGAGGASAVSSGNLGGNSCIIGPTIYAVAVGGGGGGTTGSTGRIGGSGGGGGGYAAGVNAVGNSAIQPRISFNWFPAVYDTFYGNPGGNGCGAGGEYGAGGGGGGGSQGQSGSGSVRGCGGNGFAYCITGSNITYACGGAGGGGGAPSGASGPASTGNGGAGGGISSSGPAGSGGSGIVIISYPLPCRASGGTITCVAGNVIHTFTSSGNLCIL